MRARGGRGRGKRVKGREGSRRPNGMPMWSEAEGQSREEGRCHGSWGERGMRGKLGAIALFPDLGVLPKWCAEETSRVPGTRHVGG